MSDNENGVAVGEERFGEMPAADVKFLVTCLQNTTGGALSIDKNKVAEVLNYKSVGSVANKLTKMKQKYNLPIGHCNNKATPEKATAGSRKISDVAGSNEPAIPKTPSKTHRVTKPRTTSSTKKKTTRKVKKAKAEVEAENEDDYGEYLDQEQKNDSKAAYESVFGKAESGEDA